jgi:hypothetical protein
VVEHEATGHEIEGNVRERDRLDQGDPEIDIGAGNAGKKTVFLDATKTVARAVPFGRTLPQSVYFASV